MRFVFTILALGIVLAPLACKRETPPRPTAAPATQASTRPTTKPAPTTSYVDVIRAAYPKLPATQPLALPVDLIDAGRTLRTAETQLILRDLDLASARLSLPFLQGNCAGTKSKE